MEILKRTQLIYEIMDYEGDNVRLIKGVRESGKTVLLKSIMDELKNKGVDNKNIHYISFLSCNYSDKIFTNNSIIEKEIDFLNYHAGNSDKYIITTGNYDFSGYGVKHLNIIDFLLGDEI